MLMPTYTADRRRTLVLLGIMWLALIVGALFVLDSDATRWWAVLGGAAVTVTVVARSWWGRRR
jgi:hypothetical protein